MSIAWLLTALALTGLAGGEGVWSSLRLSPLHTDKESAPLAVAFLTVVTQGAQAAGAVCLDGSPPGYYFKPGSGGGKHKWVIDIKCTCGDGRLVAHASPCCSASVRGCGCACACACACPSPQRGAGASLLRNVRVAPLGNMAAA